MRSHLSLAVLLPAGLLAVCPQGARAADALNFYNNWFVTGDYAVAGVGLEKTGGAGSITMSGVPCTSSVLGPSAKIVPCTTSGAVPAQPVAAFLYWQQVESTSTPAAVKGTFNGFPIHVRLLGSDSSSACWVTQHPQTLRAYRADVLRFLPFNSSGIRLANGTHTVALGSAVSGNSGVLATLGASLVVIYRVVAPGNPTIVPFRSVVIHDGEYTLKDKSHPMRQTVSGFYQSAWDDPDATMSHIVGNGGLGPGDAQFRGTLTVDGRTPDGVSDHPFTSAQGAAWDNLTYAFDLEENASSTSVEMNRDNNAPSCLSWSAIVTSTNVQDSDNDGLLDVWELRGLHRNTQVSPATFGGCADYPTEPCLDLPAMGAQNGVQDIFLQMDWMHGYGDGTGGLDGSGFHTHVPKLDGLTAVANAFAAHHIALHFDVGNNYQGMGLSYIIPYKTDSYGNQLAQGGSDLNESQLVCVDTPAHTCDYHEPYPVLSFKFGLGSVRDGNPFLPTPISSHFAANRKDAFHYVLWAHALGGPYGPTGLPLTPDPKSISGIGDRPGGDLMITLGLWRSVIPANDQVGSSLVQGGTLMHELGHNLGLSHAGWSTTPNCMTDYQSVMSYMYQTRGLTDGNGIEQIDYSSGKLGPFSENDPPASLGPLKYRVRYYAPFNKAVNSPGQAANVHCDGTPITDGALVVRYESPTLSTPDWSNGTNPFILPDDANFDGIKGQTFADQPDWASLSLQGIGGRVSYNGLSAGTSFDTDSGTSFDTDSGTSFDTDAGTSFDTDSGSVFISGTSFDTDSGTSFDTDSGTSFDTDSGDEDYITHLLTTTDSIPQGGLTAASEVNDIKLSWTAPGTGGTLTYNIYRCPTAGCNPAAPGFLIFSGWTPPTPSAPTYTDTVNDFVDAGATCLPSTGLNPKTCYNTPYTYSVTVVSTVVTPLNTFITESPYSNTASGTVTRLAQATVTVSAPASAAYGTPGGTAIAGGGSGTGAYSYSAAGSTACSVDPVSGVITVTSGTGTCSITAMRAGDTTYLVSAPSAAATVTILKGTQAALTVTGPASVTYGTTGTATSSGGSGTGALTFSAGTSTGCAVAGTTVSVSNASGTCSLTATMAADNNYNAATSAAFPVTLNKATQAALTVTGPASVTYGSTGTATATGGSGSGALTFSAGASTGCAVVGTTVSVSNASGTCSLTATMAADNNYNLATSAAFPVTLNKATQAALTVTGPASVTYGSTGTATSSGGSGTGALTFSAGASTGCAVVGTTVSVSNASGTCSLTATMAADNNYNAATSAVFPVTLNKATQAALTVTGPTSVTYGSTGTATSSGGSGTGALTFSAGASSGCAVTGTTVSVSNASGTCSLTATMAADNNYKAATSTAFPVTLNKVALTGTADNKSKVYGAQLPAFTATYTGFVLGQTAAVLSGTLSCTTTATAASSVSGSPYPITCSGQSSPDYSIKYVAGSLSITPAPLTIAADNKSVGDDSPTPPLTATYTTLVAGDTPSSLTGTLVCKTTRTQNSPLGKYPITCSGQTSTNYTITYVAGVLTVFLN